MDTLTAALRNTIASHSLPSPSPPFLQALTTARTPPPPLPSLLATAKARLLAADLTNPQVVDASSPGLPPAVDDATVKESKLPRGVHVQVVDIENLSLSRWEQIEEIEAIERGERTRGREIVRVAADEDDGTGPRQTQPQTQPRSANASTAAAAMAGAGRGGTHRLVLQDCKGKRVYAVELRRVDRIGVGKTSIGEKILLKAGTAVARGSILLEPDTCVLLGGKIEAWHEAWVEGRLARLKEAVGSDRPS